MRAIIHSDDLLDHCLTWPKGIVSAEIERRLRLAASARERERGWQ